MSLSKNHINTLNELTKHFKNIYDAELFFCEILGQRWSFVAGESQSYMAQDRIKINNNLGMMIDNANLSENDMKEIIEKVRAIWIYENGKR